MTLEPITPRLVLPRDALVLEIGSGHRPHPRADVLTDKYLEDVERGGQIRIDRPFVQADAERLPFRDRVFDYAICRHVLEHLEDPEPFFREITRVARAGYIEAPSLIWEHLHPTRSYHRWYVLNVEDELLLVRKPSGARSVPFGHLFERLNRYSPEYRLLIRRYAGLFYVRYQWWETVRYTVQPADDGRQAWFYEPWGEDKAARFVSPRSMSRQAFDLLAGALSSVIGGLLRRLPRPFVFRRHRAVDLAALMQCPSCTRWPLETGEG